MNDITIELECFDESSVYGFLKDRTYVVWRRADGWLMSVNCKGAEVKLVNVKLRRDISWFNKTFNLPDGWSLDGLDNHLSGGSLADAYDRAMSITHIRSSTRVGRNTTVELIKISVLKELQEQKNLYVEPNTVNVEVKAGGEAIVTWPRSAEHEMPYTNPNPNIGEPHG